MTSGVEPGDLERFRSAVGRRMGLHQDDTRLGLLRDALRARLDATGKSLAAYLEWLESPRPPRDELRALAPLLTVGETFFLRHLEQLRAFSEVALPERRRARAPQAVRVLSAGCASGEEAYSLAILIREQLGVASGQVAILGVDMNPRMLERAHAARYAPWSLRETSAELRQRWFKEDGRDFVLDPSIRSAVQLEERNLAEDDPSLWAPGAWDVVFCRNVLMYFTPEGAQALVARITRALASGGYLFLGHAETLRGLSSDYHLCHTHGTFYYQRRESVERMRSAATEPSHASVDASWTTTWIEGVQRASARIRTLTERSDAVHTTRDSQAVPSRPDLSMLIELLKRERFSDALALLRGLPDEAARDTDVLLLRAVLLTHRGDLADAEKVCAELLDLDELNSGAHYLLALCREGVGDRDGAIGHDQAALYLDATFAMPRLHLGLLARRAGQREIAQRELGQALLLLQREDASRLLLFGGGFGREALMTLCRAELAGSGGRP